MNETEIRAALGAADPGEPTPGLAEAAMATGHRRRTRRSVGVGVAAGIVAVASAITVTMLLPGQTAVPVTPATPTPSVSVSPTTSPSGSTSTTPSPSRSRTPTTATPKPTDSPTTRPSSSTTSRDETVLPGQVAALQGVSPPHASTWTTRSLSLKLCDASPGFPELNRLLAARTVSNSRPEMGEWESVLVFDGADAARAFVDRAAQQWAQACNYVETAGSVNRVTVRPSSVGGADRAAQISQWTYDPAVGSENPRPGGSQWVFATAGNVVAVIGVDGEFVGDQGRDAAVWGPLREAASSIVSADCVNRGTCAKV